MVASYQADQGDMAAARSTLQAGLARMPNANELVMQTVLLDCFTGHLTRPEWDALLALGARMHYAAIIPDLVSRFGQQERTDRCHGKMVDGDFIHLSEAVLRNPNISWRNDIKGYLYYEMSRQAAHDRNLQQTMDYLDASYSNRPNPLVARNQAIYLLTAGLPDDAIRYLRKSETTPQPWIKRKLLNVKALNAPLWESAFKMQEYFKARATAPHEPASIPAQPVKNSDSTPQ